MTALCFHAIGDWHPSQVRTAWAPRTHVMPPEAARAIDEAWQEALGRPGVKLFDGPMCRLESWQCRDDALELAMSRTSYKLFWGTNIANPQFADRFGPRALANPAGVSPALETADGFLLLGRRNASVAYYPGRLHPFAGCLEPRDDLDGSGPDPFTAVRRELNEELALTPADVPEIRLTGIVENLTLRQSELIFRARTTRTRLEIESQVHQDEHLDSVAIPTNRASIETALPGPQLTPIATAALMLWGRIAFGREWFDDQKKRLRCC